MNTLSTGDIKVLYSCLQALRLNLDRIDAILGPVKSDEVAKLDPGNPRNKSGQFLTERGIEVCYRLFDMGKPRYAVKKVMGISYGAATHRFHAWEKLGGKNRKRQLLDERAP